MIRNLKKIFRNAKRVFTSPGKFVACVGVQNQETGEQTLDAVRIELIPANREFLKLACAMGNDITNYLEAKASAEAFMRQVVKESKEEKTEGQVVH